MRKTLLLLLAPLASALGARAQDVPEPLLGVSFDRYGLVLTGQDAPNHKGGTLSIPNAQTIACPATGAHLGVTDNTGTGAWYVMYDADDAVGRAFGSSVTWEMLFRMDSHASTSKPETKIWGGQEGGGWAIAHTPGKGLTLYYVVAGGTILSCNAASAGIHTGKFYHVAVSLNRETRKVNIYLNGKLVGRDRPLSTSAFLYPNIGTVSREKDLWFCLGGDSRLTTKPVNCECSGRVSFVFANIYGQALGEAQVSSLYATDAVRRYTEPSAPDPDGDLLLDVVFHKGGAASDQSPYKLPVGKTRKPVTRYNAEQHRYEVSDEVKSNYNFFYVDYGQNPSVTSRMSEAFSLETYCRTSNPTSSKYTAPVSSQQYGGFGMEFSSGVPTFVTKTCGTEEVTSVLKDGAAGNTGYNHYVGVFDKNGRRRAFYINGQLAASGTFAPWDDLNGVYALNQWLCINGDTYSSPGRDVRDEVWLGQNSIVRLWGKALSTGDASELYRQATAAGDSVTVDSTGFAMVCAPFAAVVPEGMTAYAATRADSGRVYLSQLAEAGQAVAYGVPFVLRGEAGRHALRAADLESQRPATADGNILKGTFTAKTADTYRLTRRDGRTLLTRADAAVLAPLAAYLPYTGREELSLCVTDSVIPQTEPLDTDTVTGDNISGRVTCGGEGIAGVKVSDGYEVVKTDAEGRYSFRSQKRNGYVFYTIPSGYMPCVPDSGTRAERIIPPFFQYLASPSPNTAEVHDFLLQRENNDKHIMVVGADSHVSNSYNDLRVFQEGYVEKVRKVRREAGATPVYSSILGDMTFDYAWYSHSYDLKDFKRTLEDMDYPLRLFPVPGNHDNDGGVPVSDDTDFDGMGAFRTVISPNYYSYDMGKVHYVVIDNIWYLNTGSDKSNFGMAGSKNYYERIKEYQLEWLKKDLADVDVSTPVVLQMHSPVWRKATEAPFNTHVPYMSGTSSRDICEIMKKYRKVLILTGHEHENYHVDYPDYPTIHEHSVAAICANWWTNEALTGKHTCLDGSPGGFEVLYVDGDSITWRYHSMEDNGDAQFRAVDLNTVKAYYNENMASYLSKYPKSTDFRNCADNQIFLNVFNYSEGWKVEARENNVSLPVERVFEQDPYRLLTYELPRFRASKNGSISWPCYPFWGINHAFHIQCATATDPVDIKVTDCFGNVSTYTMYRPVPFSLDDIETATGWEDATAVTAPRAKEDEVRAVGGRICVNSPAGGMARVYDIRGRRLDMPLRAGRNELAVPRRGIYIVRTGTRSVKLFVP